MMEIKFRGKSIKTGEWFYGFAYAYEPPLQAITSIDYVHEKIDWYIIKTAFTDWNMPRSIDCVKVDPETICQYTGIKDINGKEIYNGDIIEAWSQGVRGIGEVRHRIDGLWLMYPAFQNGEFWGLCPTEDGRTTVKIIGNIYDNYELLKGKDK